MTTAIKLSPVDMDARKKLDLKAGDTVRVYSKIQEKGKTRLQAFEGLVLARKHGTEAGATITVRKISEGVGVERIFPLYSPNVDKFEVVKRANVKRSKLYFLREKTAKEIRRKLKAFGFITKTDEFEIKAEDMENEVIPEPKEETPEESK
jgi:large subunit ribosomal protein L19